VAVLLRGSGRRGGRWRSHSMIWSCNNWLLGLFLVVMIQQLSCLVSLLESYLNFSQVQKWHFFTNWSISRFFLHNLVGLFVVPVPARASTHARHVLACVVWRFSAGNYLDNNQIYPDNLSGMNNFRSAKLINYSTVHAGGSNDFARRKFTTLETAISILRAVFGDVWSRNSVKMRRKGACQNRYYSGLTPVVHGGCGAKVRLPRVQSLRKRI